MLNKKKRKKTRRKTTLPSPKAKETERRGEGAKEKYQTKKAHPIQD